MSVIPPCPQLSRSVARSEPFTNPSQLKSHMRHGSAGTLADPAMATPVLKSPRATGPLVGAKFASNQKL